MWRNSFLRFVASGAFNTAITYLAYLVLLTFMPYGWSYTCAYLLGIAIAYVMYRYVVFRRSGGRAGPVWVALIYAVQYLLGLSLVHWWVRGLGGAAALAPLFATAISLPVTFVLTRHVFRARNQPADLQPGDPKS
jgi:putative flippase GtrA